MTLRYDYHKADQWSPARVAEWLLDLSPAFSSYAAAALRSGFDGAALLSLSSAEQSEWERCGVQSRMHRQEILAHLRRLTGVVDEERWKQQQQQPPPPQGRRSPLLRAASSTADASPASAAAASSSSASAVAVAAAASSDEDKVTLMLSPTSLCYPFFPSPQLHSHSHSHGDHDHGALRLSLRLENAPGSPACLFHLISSHPAVHSFVLPAGSSASRGAVPTPADYGFIAEGGAVTVEVVVRPQEWLGIASASSSSSAAAASVANARSNLDIAEYSFSEFLFSNLVHLECFQRLQEVEPLRLAPQQKQPAPSPRVAAQERAVFERVQRHAGSECMLPDNLRSPLSPRDRFQQLSDCWAAQRDGPRSYDPSRRRSVPSADAARERMVAVRASEHAHRRIIEAFQAQLLVSHRILVSAKSLASIGRNVADIRRTSAQAMWDQSAHAAAGVDASSSPPQPSFWAYVSCLWSDGGLREKAQPAGGCVPATLSEVRDPARSGQKRSRVLSRYWNEVSNINPSLPWRSYSLGFGLPSEEDDSVPAASPLPADLSSALASVPADAQPFLVSSLDWPRGLQVARSLLQQHGADFYSRGWTEDRPRLAETMDAEENEEEEEEVPLRQAASDPSAAHRSSAQQQLTGVPQVSWHLFRTIVRLQIAFRRMKRSAAARIRSKLLRAQLTQDQSLAEKIASAKGPGAAARAKRRMTGAEFLKSQDAQLAALQAESNAAARRHSAGPSASSSSSMRASDDAAPTREALGSLAALWSQSQSFSAAAVSSPATPTAPPVVSFTIFRLIVRLQTRMRRARQVAQRKLQTTLLRAQVAETQRMLDKIAAARQQQAQAGSSKAPLKSAMKKRVSGAEWLRAQQQREQEADKNAPPIMHSEESLSIEGGFHVERFGSGLAAGSALKSSPRSSVSSGAASVQKKKKSVVWADDDAGAGEGGADEIIPAPVYSAEREAFAAQDAARASELAARAAALRASSAAEDLVQLRSNVRVFRMILRIQRRFRALKLAARERTKAKLLRQNLEDERRMAERIRQARSSGSGGAGGSSDAASAAAAAKARRRMSGAEWLQRQLAQDAADRARFIVAPQYETQESLNSSVVVEQLTPAPAAASDPTSSSSPPVGGVLRRKSVMSSANRRSSMPYADAIVAAKSSALDLNPPASSSASTSSGAARLTFGFIRLIARLQRKFKALRRAAQSRLRDKLIRARLQTERDMAEKLRAARNGSGQGLPSAASRKNKRLTGGEWLKAQLASDSASALALEARRDAAAAADRAARDRSAAASALFASLSHHVPPRINNLRVFGMIVRIQRRFHLLRARAQEKLRIKMVQQHTAQEMSLAAKLGRKSMKVERASAVGAGSAGGSRSAPSSARSSASGALVPRPRPSSSLYVPNASLLRSRLGISSLRVFHLILRIQARFLALKSRAQKRIKEKVLSEQLREAARMKEKIAAAKQHKQSVSRGSQDFDAAAAAVKGHRSTPSQTRRITGQEWLAMQLAEAQATIQSLQAAQAQQHSKPEAAAAPFQYVDSDELSSSVVHENLTPLSSSSRRDQTQADTQQQQSSHLYVRTASTPHSASNAASRSPAVPAAAGFDGSRNLLDADQQPDYLYHAVDEQGNEFVLTPVPLAEHQRRVQEQQQQQMQQAQYAPFSPQSPYFQQPPLPFRPSPPPRPPSASSFSPASAAAASASGSFTPSPPSQPRLVNVRMVERSMLSPRIVRVQQNNGVDPALQQQQPFSPYSPSAYDYTQHAVPQHHPHYAQLAAHAYGYPPPFAAPYGFPPHAAYPPAPYPYAYPPPMMAPYPFAYPPYGFHQPMPPPQPPMQQQQPQPTQQTPAPRAQPQQQQQQEPEPVAFDEFAVETAYEEEQQHQQDPPPQPRVNASSRPRAAAPVPVPVSRQPSRPPSQPVSPQRPTAAASSQQHQQHQQHPVSPSQMRVSSPSRPARSIRPGSAATARAPSADFDSAAAAPFANERPSSASSASAAAGAEFLRQKRLRRDYLRWTQSQAAGKTAAVAAVVSPSNAHVAASRPSGASRKQPPPQQQQPPLQPAYTDADSSSFVAPVDPPLPAATAAADKYDDDEYADDADFEPAQAEEEKQDDATTSPSAAAAPAIAAAVAPSSTRSSSADFRAASRLQAQYLAAATQQTQQAQSQKQAWHSSEEMKEQGSGSSSGGGRAIASTNGRVVPRSPLHQPSPSQSAQHRPRFAAAARSSSSDDFDLYQPLEEGSGYDAAAPVYPPYHSSYYKQQTRSVRSGSRPAAAAPRR